MSGEVKTVDSVIEFGHFKGQSIRDMKSPRALGYLKWMLTQVNLEAKWGDAIREHLNSMGYMYEKGDERDIHLSKEVIDKFSRLFFDVWFNHYLKNTDNGSDVKGIWTFMEIEVYNAWKTRGDLVSKTSNIDHNVFSATDERGITWVIRDTGVSLILKDVFDSNDEDGSDFDPSKDPLLEDEVDF